MGDGDHLEQNATSHVLLAVVRFGELKTYLNFVNKDKINIAFEVAFYTSRVDIPVFSPQPNTYQLIIAYDASRYETFAMYHYMDMGWDNEYTLRRSMIGYLSYKDNQEQSRQLAPSMKRTAFRMQNRMGNTGRIKHLIDISVAIAALLGRCIQRCDKAIFLTRIILKYLQTINCHKVVRYI